ncbi:MAG: hypothetical protein KIS77_05040 [Saprospiraceae bacterium]|nr:hypothetical protein [Saprospiraceae bacterium]
MELLKNFDSANKYLDLDSNKIMEYSSQVKINGWYKLIDNIPSALLVTANRLYFIWNNKKKLITNNTYIKIDDLKDLNKKTLKLYEPAMLIFQFDYNVDDNYSNVTPFEYIDDEDFDWGLFVSNIINDTERKNNFIKNIMEGPIL